MIENIEIRISNISDKDSVWPEDHVLMMIQHSCKPLCRFGHDNTDELQNNDFNSLMHISI